ncbi:unnamed protein product (macronuclear) [Paramecium tetraurelia]|uniref:Uncharacterized protein n=1 Tax=Paramecium tetraurelia TaxID=5888 RepID=A0E2F7_PARTE|nr:uncharacterized protein GSPATT00022646001 [Paramecium tetraurelia]CAK89474.1 unnamed protein product [Paramecium tetraurelia]|eukprot:XP_001456871.1 hypothetical protein (macronuclear) [Paramecium tetraurelia strain d4-2]
MNLLDLIQTEVTCSIIQVTNYFPKLMNKLTELGQETASIIQPENSFKKIQFIFAILDDVLKYRTNITILFQSIVRFESIVCIIGGITVELRRIMQRSYQGIEEKINKQTEQRLKLYCENVQELYDQQVSIEKEHKCQIHVLKSHNIYQNQQKEITQLKKELNDSQNLRKDKNHLENSKQTIVLENKYRSSIFQNGFQNQTFALKLINRKNRSITEAQEVLTKSKQSMDERQYQLSLDKTQDMITHNPRPKSRMNIKQKSMTLQLTSIQKGNTIKKP